MNRRKGTRRGKGVPRTVWCAATCSSPDVAVWVCSAGRPGLVSRSVCVAGVVRPRREVEFGREVGREAGGEAAAVQAGEACKGVPEGTCSRRVLLEGGLGGFGLRVTFDV